MTEAVSVRALFERFPATVKGAFVVRGEDPDPHQVYFRSARVVRLPSGGARDLAVAPVILDVAPHQDMYVPFEFSIADMEPGWYALETELDVDGRPRTYPGGRRLVVPWPRSAVRRGTLRVARRVSVATGLEVDVDRVEFGPDSATVHLTARPARAVEVRLEADGARLPVIDRDLDPATGRVSLVAYPVLRSHRRLRIELSPGGRAERAARRAVELDLP